MLHIDSFKQLPDGRSQIKTMGTRRFQVLQWGEKDGHSDRPAVSDSREAMPRGV